MGAWIEIRRCCVILLDIMSHPPVGAWIEMLSEGIKPFSAAVAPPVGAGIEIKINLSNAKELQESHPPWVRGLKYTTSKKNGEINSRTPRGCVD